MIARIAGSHKFLTSHRCIEMETVLLSLPVIVALPAILPFEKIFYLFDRSDPCVKVTKGYRLSMDFNYRGLSFKRYPLLSFTAIVRIGFCSQSSKNCVIVVINGNYMTQESLRVAGHKFVRSLRCYRSLSSYGKQA